MRGDSIVVEQHHLKAARGIVEILLSSIKKTKKYSLNVAGESGCGKSEIAVAVTNVLAEQGIRSVILQQDDYYVYPPKTNDHKRRQDIGWVGVQEVRLDVLDANLKAFLDGQAQIDKPLISYAEDRIDTETMAVGDAQVAIAEGTYTSLLQNLNSRVFIDRTYHDSRAHREKRNRDEAELGDFVERVLGIEHTIISAHKAKADILIGQDYSASAQTG